MYKLVQNSFYSCFHTGNNSFYSYLYICYNIYYINRKAIRKKRKAHHTVPNYVKRRKLAERGHEEYHKGTHLFTFIQTLSLVLTDILYLAVSNAFISMKDERSKLSSRKDEECYYNHFCQMCISSFFVCAPQGRISGHWALRWRDRHALLNSEAVYTSDFKTEQKYGYQPIFAGPLCRDIILYFICK